MYKEYVCGFLEFKTLKQNSGLESAVALMEEIEQDGKISKFATVFYEKNINLTSKINIISFAVVCAKIKYNVKQSIRILTELIAAKRDALNPRLLQFCKDRLNEITDS